MPELAGCCSILANPVDGQNVRESRTSTKRDNVPVDDNLPIGGDMKIRKGRDMRFAVSIPQDVTDRAFNPDPARLRRFR
jgi:hypothetical protein